MVDLLTYAQVVAGCYDDGSAPTFQDDAGLTHVYLTIVNGFPHFNFQGTLDAAEWINRDLDAIGLASFEHPIYGVLHDGFARGAFGVVDQIDSCLVRRGSPPYTIGGHSKGAGEVQIAAAELIRRRRPPKAIYLFEPPKAGTSTLKSKLIGVEIHATQTYNAVGADLVTETPTQPWVHVTPLQRLAVPDAYDIATKHRIRAVIEALKGENHA